MKKSKMDWEAHSKKDNLEEELNNKKILKSQLLTKMISYCGQIMM